MSNHFDYMPKPDGWTPPEENVRSEVEEAEAVAPVAEAVAVEENLAKPVSDVPVQPEDNTPLERFVTLCANIISWVFVPLLMPVYGIILIFSLSFLSFAPFHTKLVFTLIVFGANFIVPMLLVLLLKKLKMIEDIGLNGRRERLIPYIITIICLSGTGLFLYLKMAPLWVAMFYAGGALAALINLLVNFRWKISAHAAGMAGVVAMLIQVIKEGPSSQGMEWWIVGAIITAGLLGSSRIWLGRHTLMQVLAGTAVGFLCVWTLSLI
ncbi:MAG: phosphatase PAP2 family protein [Muribaculaceae bacterium]|nr:phosphatase PAP2 family protein [Muribaculaceae bacterium]MDE6633393.1 phosphatase PAP2 family protein [Muribaculaceae bacterium]